MVAKKLRLIYLDLPMATPSLLNKPLNFWLGGGIRGWLTIGGRRIIQEKES